MNVNEPSVHSAAEDLSDRSNSSNSENQLHAFQEYDKIKELNLSINRAKDLSPNKTKDFSFALDGSRQYGVSLGSLTADRPTKDLPVALDKPKEFDFHSEKIKDASNYSLDRSEDTDASLDANPQNRSKDKDVIFSFDGIKDAHFSREARDARTKNIHFPHDKNKDSNFQKTYNHPLDRIKEFSFGLDRRQDSQIGGVALERLRGGSFLEPADYRNPQVQPRDEFEVLAIERMRRSHILTSDIAPRNLPPHLPHPHSITDMQHSQQQQQQQGKSFTIDSILGLRNNQREKPQRSQLHPYRKHQGQEGSVKNISSGSSAGCGGKLKRVRTIFTAEQLERLEGEFARQQYMVGPERLYLAHALRLTEAQVKVWFQNRRIKWRKLHHEQQSQRLHELHSLSSLEQDAEDSNDNACSGSRILDTISEHTEPSPVPSTTMDQTDLEAQSQTRKLRRARHSASNWSSYASRLPADGTSASDCHWKTTPRPTHSVPHSHEHRRQEYGIAEPVTSCYSALNTYRPKHRASVSPLPKSSHIPASDQSYRTPGQQSVRTARNKLLTTNNLAVVRKGCYKDDVEEDDDINEEEGNYADDNVEEDAAEEADEDQEDQPYEYNDKDYEEQEADDEVDDESDAFQAQLHRMMQHKMNKAANQRSQPVRHSEHQQDLRKVHHQPHVHKVYQDQKPPRFYPQPSETQQPIVHDTSYGDAAEAVSDDQHTPPWTPDARRSMQRSSETNPSWVQTRKSGDRNRDRVSSSAVTGQEQQRYHRQHQLQLQQAQLQHQQQQRQQVRKHRSSKPEIESLMMPPQSNPTTKKCCLCGGSTAPYTTMVGSNRKENCRLHEYRGFTVKGPSGEDGEAEEQVVCGRCERRYNKEDLRLGCETSPPEPGVPIYPAKSNRSRIRRSSTYNFPEDNQTVDEMLAAYASSQPRSSTADYGMAPRERTRHAVQTARSPMRRPSYYDR